MRATVINTKDTPVAPPKHAPTLTVTNDGAHSTVVGGSTAGLRLACSASRIEERKAGRSTNRYADRGTALHHIVEEALVDDMSDREVLGAWSGVSIGPDGKVQIPDSDMVHTIDIDADLLKAKVLPALAYFDVTVPRHAKFWIEQKVGLYFPDAETNFAVPVGSDFEEIAGAFGTADVTFVDRHSRRAGVIDWKFGDGIIVPAEDNDQMRFYLVGAIMHGLLPIQQEYEAHIFQPADSMHPDEYGSKGVYTLDDLVRFSRELADAMKAEPVHNVGPHCAKCNGRMVCAAFQDTLTTAVMTDVPGMSAKDLAQQLRLLPAVAKFIEDVKAAALRNAQAGVDIPGYGLEPSLGNSAWRDEDKAERALALRGIGVSDRRVVKTISPTQAVKLLTPLLNEKELDRFKNTHIFRPDTGQKLVPVKDGERGNGNPIAALKRLGKAIVARGLA